MLETNTANEVGNHPIAETGFHSAAIRAATGEQGAHVVLDAVGTGAAPDATIAAIGTLAFGGRAVLVSVGLSSLLALDYTHITYNEIAVSGSLWFPPRGRRDDRHDRRVNA
jgi:threonine dehydrogenase-like Zn-dependent dehydrogenase